MSLSDESIKWKDITIILQSLRAMYYNEHTNYTISVLHLFANVHGLPFTLVSARKCTQTVTN